MSKLYLNCVVRIWSLAFAGVHAVNAVNPGHTRTDMTGNKGKFSVEESVKPFLYLINLHFPQNVTGEICVA